MKRNPLVYQPNGDIGPIKDKADYIESNSFSRNQIREEEFVFIPEDSQMIVFNGLKLKGELKLSGELCLL